MALNYEQALLDLTELKHENEKLRELLKDEKILARMKFTMDKQSGNAVQAEISNGFEKKQQWVDREKSETLVHLPSNGFSTKHEVSTFTTSGAWNCLLHNLSKIEIKSLLLLFFRHMCF